jgi:hypothetical protein
MTGLGNLCKAATVGCLFVPAVCLLLVGCGSRTYSRLSPGMGSGDGGQFGSGGSGTGGAGMGGTIGTGGMLDMGGDSGTGGVPGTGGNVGTGGMTATGGVSGTGGMETGGGGAGDGGMGGGGLAGRGGRGAAGAAGAGGGGGAGGAIGDTARYNFEANTQLWMGATDAGLTPFTMVARSTAQHFAGIASLAGTITLPANGLSALVALPPMSPIPAPGTTVTYHIFVPTGSLVDWVQPYVQEIAPSYVFTATVGGAQFVTAANIGTWLSYTVVVPGNALMIGTLGVQFHASAAWTGTVYVDSITW